MKTAISIPNSTFNSAEKLAQRLGKSRSALYSEAIESYVSSHQKDEVTKKLNEVYGSQSSKLDPVLENLQTQSWAKNNPW